MFKQFGGKATKDLTKSYADSPNWKDGKFENLEETKMEFTIDAVPKLLYKQFFDKKGRVPQAPIPVMESNWDHFMQDHQEAKFIWFGHSVVCIKIHDKTILIDPMLGPDAAPIAPIASARFSENTLDIIDALPEIDILLQTHDHYDHLDLKSIQKLKPKVKQYWTALGVGRHLEEWGIPSDLITEFDWWDSKSLDDLKITFTPSRHFSGRGLTDRAKSLWGGWSIRSNHENIYFSGDGGFGQHFKKIGNELGPFDFGFMECGQYNKYWRQIHMYPEESVQASIDAQVKKSTPVHWAGFALALHHWHDPANRFHHEALEKGIPTVYPRIGKVFTKSIDIQELWWKDLP